MRVTMLFLPRKSIQAHRPSPRSSAPVPQVRWANWSKLIRATPPYCERPVNSFLLYAVDVLMCSHEPPFILSLNLALSRHLPQYTLVSTKPQQSTFSWDNHSFNSSSFAFPADTPIPPICFKTSRNSSSLLSQIVSPQVSLSCCSWKLLCKVKLPLALEEKTVCIVIFLEEVLTPFLLRFFLVRWDTQIIFPVWQELYPPGSSRRHADATSASCVFTASPPAPWRSQQVSYRVFWTLLDQSLSRHLLVCWN